MDKSPQSRAMKSKACLTLDGRGSMIRFQKRTGEEFRKNNYSPELGSSVGRWSGSGVKPHIKAKKSYTKTCVAMYI